MKRAIAIVFSIVLIVLTTGLAAADESANSTDNKKLILSELKTALNNDVGLDIYNDVEKILMLDDIVVTDAQREEILGIDFASELSEIEYKGIVWSDYTSKEQAGAMRLANRICDILGLTFKIDPSGDYQQQSDISISIYKDGKRVGVIRGDAKTDIATLPSYWYLVGGGALVLLAAGVALIVFRNREVAQG